MHVLLIRHYTQSNGESPRKTSALHIEQSNMASDYAQEKNSLSPYRKLLVDLSFDLSKKEVETLKLAGVDFIPRRMTEKIVTGLHLFDVLEQDDRIGPHNLNLLQDMLKTVGRVDLARKIQAFLTTSEKGETDGKISEKFEYYFYQPQDQDSMKRCFRNLIWCVLVGWRALLVISQSKLCQCINLYRLYNYEGNPDFIRETFIVTEF